jgi:hypothetical protein
LVYEKFKGYLTEYAFFLDKPYFKIDYSTLFPDEIVQTNFDLSKPVQNFSCYTYIMSCCKKAIEELIPGIVSFVSEQSKEPLGVFNPNLYLKAI